LEGGIFLVQAESTRKGGKTDIQIEKDRKKQEMLLKVLTKLKCLRYQVTLSQIPPSQKETYGVKSNSRFTAHPHTNSSISVAYEPAGDLCWPVKLAFQQFRWCFEVLLKLSWWSWWVLRWGGIGCGAVKVSELLVGGAVGLQREWLTEEVVKEVAKGSWKRQDGWD
jgi:hypothetical protein